MLMKTISKNIRKHRELCGLSKADLAKAAHISETHLSQVESGQKRISLETLGEVIKCLKCSFNDICQENAQIGGGNNLSNANDIITFKFSNKDESAEITLPSDIDEKRLEIAIDKTSSVIKGSPTTEISEKLAQPLAVGGDTATSSLDEYDPFTWKGKHPKEQRQEEQKRIQDAADAKMPHIKVDPYSD